VLAKAGRSVVAHDWYARVGLRLLGDFQGLEKWRNGNDALAELREWGIGADFLVHSLKGGIG
jgi:hypothetical protein